MPGEFLADADGFWKFLGDQTNRNRNQMGLLAAGRKRGEKNPSLVENMKKACSLWRNSPPPSPHLSFFKVFVPPGRIVQDVSHLFLLLLRGGFFFQSHNLGLF